MNFLKKISLFLPACFIICYCAAQEVKKESIGTQYRAVHWGLEEGLSQAETYFMIKDVNGFLWIGTQQGLNRFDGNSFKIYFHNPDKKESVSSNSVAGGFVEDSLHNIWIGTASGLSRYDIKADTFTNFFSASVEKAEKPGAISPFWAGKNEVYCIESNFQVTSYNVHSYAKKSIVKLDASDGVGNGTSISYSYFDTVSNSFWIIASKIGQPGGGLLKLNIKNGEKQFYDIPCSKNIVNHSHDAEAMVYDPNRNSLWINSTEGLIEFNLSDRKFHSIPAFDEWVKLKEYGRFVGIARDKQGRIWMSSYPAGITIYNPQDKTLQQLFPDDPELQKQVSYENACLYIDKDDIIWSGFWSRKGLFELAPYSEVITRYYADKKNEDNSITGIKTEGVINADNGKLWIGTSNGLTIFDPVSNTAKNLTDKDLPGINSNEIIPVAIDTAARKGWLMTTLNNMFGTLFEIDLQTKKCKPVVLADSTGKIISQNDYFLIPPARYLGITPYKKGFFISIIYKKKHWLYIINSKTELPKPILSFPEFSVWPYSATNDKDRLFLSSQNKEYNLSYLLNSNNTWIKSPTLFDSIQGNRIVYNKPDNTYWVTSFQQLTQYSSEFKVLKRFTTDDGLPQLEIYGLSTDHKGNVWFNTDRSIYQLDIQTGKISVLTEKDGFKTQNFTPGEMRRTKDIYGNIYFPAGMFGNGFDKVNPNNFTSPPSSVYIESIEINQNRLPISAIANHGEVLKLKYFENKISITTGIIDYFSKGKSRIRYKLDKLDTMWQYAPYYYTIRYEGLPPGKYTLFLQASNGANEFTGTIKTLFIQINPAFWNTWWFRILAFISLGFLFYGIIRWRLQQKFSLQLERSEKEIQIAEIKQKATELEMQALRAQMNPHFIFNSLNSINRFILQNNRAQASEYLTKFSKLVRLILQNSQASLITLESELESLDLYLNLEALRFNYHFDYKISVPKGMDIEVLKVPPLILQPYVENAIWHGLMHKEEKGQLNIDISEENNHVYFKITDNGIGRKRASELSSKSATKHKSMGLRITAHRIAMMQNSNGVESPVKINDLVDPDGNPTGTEVIIKMPVLYD